jgi:hypothetical protein
MPEENSTHEILLEVLNIIEYQEDKQKFIDDFLANAQKQAAVNILQMLPQEKKEALQKQEENKDLFAEIFTPEVMDKALIDVMVLQFQGFLQTIIPTLPSEKKDKLLHYLDSISPETDMV